MKQGVNTMQAWNPLPGKRLTKAPQEKLLDMKFKELKEKVKKTQLTDPKKLAEQNKGLKKWPDQYEDLTGEPWDSDMDDSFYGV